MVMITHEKPSGNGLRSLFFRADEKLHEPGLFNDTLDKLEQKTRLKRMYMVIGMLVTFTLLLLFGPQAGVLCNMIGFIHPAHATAKALETGGEGPEDLQALLAYWLLYSFLCAVESLPGRGLLQRIPAYWLIKCVVLLYLHSPVSMGARNLRLYFVKSAAAVTSIKESVSNEVGKYPSVVEPSSKSSHAESHEKST